MGHEVKAAKTREFEKPQVGVLGPDPEMWAALERGAKLSEILDDFYTRVYQDPRLSPFFDGVTKDWVARKQYSFMRSKFTGEKIFFGNRPRNAHHWMVISDDLFDHREALMECCLRDAGLPPHLIARWRALDEAFRKQIVKQEAIPRKVSGVPIPLEGHGSVTLEDGTLCDVCQAPVDAGTLVHYHLRTGTTFCLDCMPSPVASEAARAPAAP